MKQSMLNEKKKQVDNNLDELIIKIKMSCLLSKIYRRLMDDEKAVKILTQAYNENQKLV